MHIRSDLPDIAIMVSHRIDVNSILVDNPLYYPMRCGAVFDKNPIPNIPGDNTGENISANRENYCELTVQYWAWKNLQADYYGLCHYRRYLSFSDRHYHTNDHGLVPRPLLNEREMSRFGLLEPEHMAEEIAQYDAIIPQAAEVKKMPLPHGRAKTVRDLWEAHDGIFFDKSMIDLMLQSIRTFMPQYIRAADEYLAGGLHYGYNCYVMRRSLFEQLCEFQFTVLHSLEGALSNAEQYPRTLAYIGEMLFGIFVYQIANIVHRKICEKQIIYFSVTTNCQSCRMFFYYRFRLIIDQVIRCIVKPFFPYGSCRRENAKKIYHKLFK